MATIPKWPGSGSVVSVSSSSTPYGFYDDDVQFQTDAPKIANWVARRLGYPITDVELQDLQIYACFEEAITEYGAQVHQFNIRQNMLKTQGSETGSSLNGTAINSGDIPSLIELAGDYGSEAGVGGSVDYEKGYIEVRQGKQVYDLLTDASSSLNPSSSQYGSGSASTPTSFIKGQSNIEIKFVYHDDIPASTAFYGLGGYAGYRNLIDDFGFTQYGYTNTGPGRYLMYPMYEDLLRMQAIEFFQEFRKSAYTFKLRNNQLTVFPVPDGKFKIWFDYIEKDDRSNIKNRSKTGVVSDYSNVPYNNLVYSEINDVGKQWIRKYTLALSKEVLGEIREKYSNIPIPGDQISLNGPSLRSEAQTEKDALIQQLRDNLEQTSRQKQVEMESDISDKMQQQLGRIPNKIYIG